jgi:hypothetical protein
MRNAAPDWPAHKVIEARELGQREVMEFGRARLDLAQANNEARSGGCSGLADLNDLGESFGVTPLGGDLGLWRKG